MDFCLTAGTEPRPAESWPEVSALLPPKKTPCLLFPREKPRKNKDAESAASLRTDSGEPEMPVVKNPHRRPPEMCESMLT